jgi:acetyl-CoA carboxylase biotin carboxyl carrier protein
VSLKKSGGNPAARLQDEPVTERVPVQEEPAKESAPVKEEPKEEKLQEVKEDKQDEDSNNAAYEIVSPMVGTFYAAPTPESDPYVAKGTTVENATVVCIVEAMKLFNEIEAEVSGEIVEVLAEDGELVEYGQPLFRVNRT